MKHLIRKSLSMLLVLATLLTSIPFAAFAEEVVFTEEPVILISEEAAVELPPEPIVETVVEPITEPTTETTIGAIVESSPVPTQEITVEPTIETVETPEPIPTEEMTAEPAPELTPEVSVEPTVEPSMEPSEEPIVEPTVEPTVETTAEPTPEVAITPEAMPSEQPTVEPMPELTPEVSMEPTLEPSAEPSIEPTAYPTFVPKKAPSDDAVCSSGNSGNAPFFPVYTVEALAEYMDMSISELAEALGMEKDELLVLPAEEIAEYHEMLATPISTYASAGKISLGKKFSGTAHTSYTQDYEISISRSGRYLLTMTGSKWMQVIVYNGSADIGGIGRACNGYTTNWTVDLEAGKTYRFEVAVDSRYSTGYSDYEATLKLHIDGNYYDRAQSLAYDVYAPFEVEYSNDYQIFCFTALAGKQYRIHTTGSMYRYIEICDGNLNVVKTSSQDIYGTKYFDVTLTPWSTYYIVIHGRDYDTSIDGWWYETGSGEVKIECLDSSTSGVTFTKNKSSVDPGFADSITFNVSSSYASKVRLLVDGYFVGAEHSVYNGKASFSQSFHVSGSRSVQVQGYYNGSWSLLSQPQTITVNYLSALGTPVFSSISNNKGTAYQNQAYTLKWKPLSGAIKYSAYVYSGNEQIYKVDCDTNQVTIPGEIFGTLGIYYVDVYGMANLGQQSNPGARAEITVVEKTDEEFEIIGYTGISLGNNAYEWEFEVSGATGTVYFSYTQYRDGSSYVPTPWSTNNTFLATADETGDYYVVVQAKDSSGKTDDLTT